VWFITEPACLNLVSWLEYSQSKISSYCAIISLTRFSHIYRTKGNFHSEEECCCRCQEYHINENWPRWCFDWWVLWNHFLWLGDPVLTTKGLCSYEGAWQVELKERKGDTRRLLFGIQHYLLQKLEGRYLCF